MDRQIIIDACRQILDATVAIMEAVAEDQTKEQAALEAMGQPKEAQP